MSTSNMTPHFGGSSSILAHALLLISSLWSYQHFDGTVSFLRVSMSVHLIIGFIGACGNLVTKYGTPHQLANITSWYTTCFNVSCFLALPCMVAQFYLNYRYPSEVAVAHVLLAIIPYLNQNRNYLDALIVANLCSLTYVSQRHNNLYALLVVPLYGVNFFIVQKRETVFEILAGDVFVMLLAACNYFIIEALMFCK